MSGKNLGKGILSQISTEGGRIGPTRGRGVSWGGKKLPKKGGSQWNLLLQGHWGCLGGGKKKESLQEGLGGKVRSLGTKNRSRKINARPAGENASPGGSTSKKRGNEKAGGIGLLSWFSTSKKTLIQRQKNTASEIGKGERGGEEGGGGIGEGNLREVGGDSVQDVPARNLSKKRVKPKNLGEVR